MLIIISVSRSECIRNGMKRESGVLEQVVPAFEVDIIFLINPEQSPLL